MLQSLRNHDLQLCPACGEAGAPNTLDHYLPKGKYPHFCVTPHNLFPMCDACQRRKGDRTGDENNPRFSFIRISMFLLDNKSLSSRSIHLLISRRSV